MTFRDLCTKEIVQLQNGVCLGKADDLTFDPATARIENLRLLGQPKLFGLLGRDEELIIPWGDIETSGRTRSWCTLCCRPGKTAQKKQRQARVFSLV